ICAGYLELIDLGLSMELQSNCAASFTKWVTTQGLLASPFVLIDIGVQGGESERWRALGDCLVLHGFDAIEEVIEGLKIENCERSNHHFHCIAAGDFDGEQTLFFYANDPYSSSLYEKGMTRFIEGAPTATPRRVPVRKLDTLLSEGFIPRAD